MTPVIPIRSRQERAVAVLPWILVWLLGLGNWAEFVVAAEGGSGSDAMKATCRLKRSSAELRKAAGAALGSPLEDQLTLLLPDRWPDPRRATFYTYDWFPLPTGVVAYSVKGPLRRVVFDSSASPPRVELLRRGKDLGREDEKSFGREEPTREALGLAEQALLEVIDGCQSPAAVFPKLEPYRTWLNAHPLVAKDLGKREPAFIKWLLAKETKAP